MQSVVVMHGDSIQKGPSSDEEESDGQLWSPIIIATVNAGNTAIT